MRSILETSSMLSGIISPTARENTTLCQSRLVGRHAHGKNALPLLAIPKISAELKLRTVIDARERNANTVIDSTPLPNQDSLGRR